MIKTFILRIFLTLSLISFIALACILGVFYHFGTGLPNYSQLAAYEPQILSRFYAQDGKLMAEHAIEKRLFVPITAIPKRILRTFVAVEDKNFYTHSGIDLTAILRSFGRNVANIAKSRRPEGASTITQQVARNFLLSNELSYGRKIKEAILAIRIEQAFSKDTILELYVNEIYLGAKSYGVAAAALNYFNKALDELSIAEAAYLAALPKAPNNYDPVKNPQGAKARRDWVIGRMLDENIITPQEAEQASHEPITFKKRSDDHIVHADYFGEEVRRNIIQSFGESALYTGGLVVRTSLDSAYQKIADRVLSEGLVSYDRRHGWRGCLHKLKGEMLAKEAWKVSLKGISDPAGLRNGVKSYDVAVILELTANKADIGLKNGTLGSIPLEKMKWAKTGVTHPKMLFDVGDVILVENVKNQVYALAQIPEVSGALIAMDPHTGRVLALTGGYSFDISQFNRATQAQRQPGSAFKPFVYLTAFEQDIPPTFVIEDEPLNIDMGKNQETWSPKNYGKTYYGPMTIRQAMEKSRNTVTVRLGQKVGMRAVSETAKRFNIYENMPLHLSMVLGTGETTPLRLTTAYAQIANGGKEVTPSLIDWVQDRRGKIIFRHDKRQYDSSKKIDFDLQDIPELIDFRKQICDPVSIHQITSVLEGVATRGSGRLMKSLNIPIACKTGSSQDSMSTWLMGFTPNLVVGVFVGFDRPKNMGKTETGATLPGPIFFEFMKDALKNVPPVPFRTPQGIYLKRVNLHTGQPTSPKDTDAIWEVFKESQKSPEKGAEALSSPLLQGTGGLY